MGVKNPKAKYPLPDNIHPEGLRCFQVLIPDEPHYVAAFRGAMLAYASPISWQDDPEHKAKEVGEVLAPLIADMETCEENMLDVRQNPTLPCILEKRPGSGDWEQFANLQLCPPKMRLSDGHLQWWDGSQWVDQPGSGDERFDGETTPPWPAPPAGETGNCLTAENVSALLKTQVDQWIELLAISAAVMTFVLVITGILTAFFIPPATPAIIGFIDILIGLGEAGLSGAFTSDVYDRFKCIISCHSQDDGSITTDDYEAIVNDVQHESGTAWDIIEIWIGWFGPVGLTRAAKSSGITSGNCDDCGCPWSDDFYIDAWNNLARATRNKTTVGKNYKVRCEGTWQVGDAPWGRINGDACYREASAPGDWTATDVVMWLDGSPLSPKPAYTPTHIYEVTVAGTGDYFGFICGDSNRSDNTGQIHVFVEQID